MSLTDELSRTHVPDLDVLWQPMRIGSVEVANRIFMPAHHTGFDFDRHAAYLARRIRGGAGLVITGAMPVHESSVASLTQVQVFREDNIAGLRGVATAVHAEGGRIFGQIFHVGPNDPGTVDLDLVHPTFGPTDVAGPLTGRTPVAMDEADIATVVDA